MQKRLLALVLALCTLLLVSCGGRQEKTAITFSENGILTAEFSTATSGTIVLPQPAGTHAAFCVGWTATVDGQHLFLPIGSSFSYKKGDAIDFSPVYLHMTTLHNVQLTFSTDTGILYTTTVGAGEIDHLTSIGANPQFDTLIIADSTVKQLSAFTHAALSAAIPEYILPAHTTTIHGDKASFDTLLENISVNNRLTPYTGVGYARLTYSNGETAYIYAGYEVTGLPSASVFALAKAATEDLSDTQTGPYQTPIEDKFSPYSAEAYAILKSYVQFALTLVFNDKIAGNRGLSEDLLKVFNQRTIQQGNKDCAEEWSILRDMIPDIRQNGALVITAKDGTYIRRSDVSMVTYQSRSGITTALETAVYYNGSIYIPYTTWSHNV